MQNSTSKPTTELDTGANSDSEVGPLSILPICVSLFAVVAVAIAAILFYRKRQRQRAQLLARQLRLTERRIDVVGNIREKKEERKSLYRPPTDVRASASEPSIVSRRIPGIRPHYVIRAYQPRPRAGANPPLSAVNTSACSCDYGESTFCSTCKEEEKRNAKESKIDASAGSLAVELDTVPSVSSLSTIRTPAGQPTIRRTQSETAAGESVRHTSSLKSSVASIPKKDDTTPSRQIIAWMEKATTARSNSPLATATVLDLQPSSAASLPAVPVAAATAVTSEQKPPHNTPASPSLATSDAEGVVEKTLSYVSESAQSEEWV